MKPARRSISGILSLLMLCSLWLTGLPAARAAGAAEAGLTGSIGLTLRFDLPQKAENAEKRDIQLQVSGAGRELTVPLPQGTQDIPVEVDNQEGAPLGGEEYVGYYKVKLTGLADKNTYRLTLSGKGYKTFTQEVTLDGFSKHIIVGTGDDTFTLGDMNGDGRVDKTDWDAFAGQDKLGGTDSIFDLNGDGAVEITDLAYVHQNVGASGEAKVLDTTAIVSPTVETEKLTLTDAASGEAAAAADLFQDGGKDVKLAPKDAEQGGGELSLPIVLETPVEMEQIGITCPEGPGAIQQGKALVTYEEDGEERQEEISFDITPPEGVHATGREAGEQVVTIDLGKKVAVKKITISVTLTQDGTDYAVVRKIEFLKDIVPENPKKVQPEITSVTVGDGSVTLEWTQVTNVTGYVVHYAAQGSAAQQTQASSTKATVTGLDNLKEYRFYVVAVNGDWTSAPSQTVTATPQPGSAPGAPSNISIKAADSSLRVSWGKTKDADRYQVFYRQAGQEEFKQFGSTLINITSTIITGLTNGTQYDVAVKAGNSVGGFGPYSAIATETPKKEELNMPDLPEEGRIDNSHITSVELYQPGNVNKTLCPNFVPRHVADNDASTYWVAATWWNPARFTFKFDEPYDMNYAILVNYAGHLNCLESYCVTAKNSSGETVLAADKGSYRFRNTAKDYLVLTFPMLEDVVELTIEVSEKASKGRCIADIAFYESDTLANEIADLFANSAFTTLKEEVTGETLDVLSARLEAKKDFYLDLDRLRDELALARALLNGTAQLSVRQNFQSRGGGQDSQYGQGGSDLQPLGVTARAGAKVAVYAELPGDKPVYVVPTQYYGESGIWKGNAIELVNGRNYITVPKIGSLKDERGGPLYLTYAGEHPEQIKVQVRGDNNVFTTTPVLELSGWYGMDEAARKAAIEAYVTQLESYVGALNSRNLQIDIRNTTEISTPSVLLSIPASQALAGLAGKDKVQAMYDNVLAWEDELFVANKVQGIIASDAPREGYEYPMTLRQNIRYMRMFAGAFMYAAGNHVGIGFGSTSGMVCGRPVSVTGVGQPNGLFGWGIAHEIGHNMDKLGKAEITNNIYSLAIQAYDGSAMKQNTRLTNSNIWQGIYSKTSAGRPGSAGNVFVQLGMYWQLHLAYDEAAEPLQFYNRFFTAWKAGEYKSYTYDERVALIASKTAGRDLTEFFTRWGMTLGAEAKAEMSKLPAEKRAVWYLNDASYAIRLDGGLEAGLPAVAVEAGVQENQAVLTITGGNESVLGYEIRRGGKSIAFTTEPTYTDDLGPANNLTYTYSVVPVDKLGNMGAEAKAAEVRVAYDKTISPDLYETAREGQTLTFTMKDQTRAIPITGVKITGTDLQGNYQVEVFAEAGQKEGTVAKKGVLSGGETVAYFTKPGADASDTRIWTYDALSVRITGLPEGATAELLDYPGDRVDFYEGAAVGKLAHDYTYTDAEDQPQVIPAGTLVMTGTYRGDPVYDFVEIQGRYDTTGEAMEDSEEGGQSTAERPLSGYALLFAEIPADGAVSATSDGFWLFVPELQPGSGEDAGQTGDVPQGAANRQGPMEIRAVLYITDDPENDQSKRVSSQTLWISCPDYDSLPQIRLTADENAK